MDTALEDEEPSCNDYLYRGKVISRHHRQVIILPPEIVFPASTKVAVLASGDIRVIPPVVGSWDERFDGPGVSEDFMIERSRPVDHDRR